MELRLTVGGDETGGWLVDIHDGDKNASYSPVATTAVEAARAALNEHAPPVPVVKPDKGKPDKP